MKTSFVTTVLNEEKSINDLLDSLFAQSKKPDEIIIVDAGSKDKTVDLIKKHQLPVKLIQKPGLNRSQGRNLGIAKAQHTIIVISDAGCTLEKEWLQRITDPFKSHNVDSVAGFYQPQTNSVLSKSMAPFIAVMPDKFDDQKYLPSSRSIAFKKSAWQAVGKYPENLNYCEDLIFAKDLKQKTNMITRSDALVFWQTPDNLKDFFQSIKNYALGDIQAKYKPHTKKIATVFARYAIFSGFPIFFLFYQLWPIFKFYHYINNPLAFIYLPFLQIIKDLAIMLGSLYGLF
ncbi:glycosyltransferase [Patescibacteria group bacterium]